MGIAEAGAFFWIFVALIVGVLGFFMMVVVLLAKVGQAVLRAVFGLGRPPESAALGGPGVPRRCLNTRCRCTNRATARYCGRCGQPLA